MSPPATSPRGGGDSFAAHARVLRLYCAAMSGGALAVKSCDELPASQRVGVLAGQDLPCTDGDAIYLPAMPDGLVDQRLGFDFYKVAILHQLGCRRARRESFAAGPSAPESLRARRRPTLSDPAVGQTSVELSTLGDGFASFSSPSVAAAIFAIFEGARIDAELARRYPGVGGALARLMADAVARRPSLLALAERAARERAAEIAALCEALLQHTLDGLLATALPARLQRRFAELLAIADRLTAGATTVMDSVAATLAAYALVLPDPAMTVEINLPAVPYRGVYDVERHERALVDLQLPPARARVTLDRQVRAEPSGGHLFSPFAGELSHDSLAGSVPGVVPARGPSARRGAEIGSMGESPALPASDGGSPAHATFFYDEWDHRHGRYRPHWCRLIESPLDDGDPDFVAAARRDHAELLAEVRRQLGRLRPDVYRRVRRLIDGEELDLDAAVEALTDLAAGVSPSDQVYERRQRLERDVIAVFLLDLSASTDSPVMSPATTPSVSPQASPPTPAFVDILNEDSLWVGGGAPSSAPPRRRVVDVEKEAVVLMADALEELGDAYAVYGFSGLGRRQVDFFVAKELDERWDERVEGRIAAMKPCRSTRMGTAVRHALYKLSGREAGRKVLVILSDGYPQDIDYGEDRTSREHGLRDTMMALREAHLCGVQPFCITVDPAGHDYLRQMCPDERYLVIDDVGALPRVLPKVYRGLTS